MVQPPQNCWLLCYQKWSVPGRGQHGPMPAAAPGQGWTGLWRKTRTAGDLRGRGYQKNRKRADWSDSLSERTWGWAVRPQLCCWPQLAALASPVGKKPPPGSHLQHLRLQVLSPGLPPALPHLQQSRAASGDTRRAHVAHYRRRGVTLTLLPHAVAVVAARQICFTPAEQHRECAQGGFTFKLAFTCCGHSCSQA